jgi:hypothetical protein
MTEESRTDFSSNQSRKPFFSPAYATKRCIAIFRQSPFSKQSIRARPRFSQKNPSSNPHPNFPTNFDGSQLAKIQQTRQRNPSHPSSSERSIGRTIRSIDRSGRVARSSTPASTVSDVERIASRHDTPRLTIRIAPHIRVETSRTARDRWPSPDPPLSRGSHTHTARRIGWNRSRRENAPCPPASWRQPFWYHRVGCSRRRR